MWEGEDDGEYDVVGIGFGPANLSVAIALSEDPRTAHLRVKFIERYPSFLWHPGMMIAGAKMQISFMKDLVSLRNPRSPFTFLNYLHEKERLVDFINLSTFLPSRIEYADYLKWCADQFLDKVQYGTLVETLEPIYAEKGEKSGEKLVEGLRIIGKRKDGSRSHMVAKNLIIGIGGSANLPRLFQNVITTHRVFHTQQYVEQKANVLKNREDPYRIAVVGGGQSSAEVFLDLIHSYPNAEIQLILRSSALRPADDSPFVNEVFNPEFVSYIYNLEENERKRFVQENRMTNYSVVRIELIEKIYEVLYQQKMEDRKKRLKIVNLTQIDNARSNDDGKVILTLSPVDPNAAAHTTLGLVDPVIDTRRTEPLDLVMVATGYDHTSWKDITRSFDRYLEIDSSSPQVTRDYRVATRSQFRPSIWLQGASEASHGLSDTLLSLLSIRSREIVDSILQHGYKLSSSSPSSSSSIQLRPLDHPLSRKPITTDEDEDNDSAPPLQYSDSQSSLQSESSGTSSTCRQCGRRIPSNVEGPCKGREAAPAKSDCSDHTFALGELRL